jgi:AcrR family transcriptional regulator
MDSIVTAVERVLEKHGPEGLTTNRVAEVAGVSVGTLYHYFPNKESLIAALQERVLQALLTAFRVLLSVGEDVPLDMLARRTGDAFLAVYAAQRPMHRWLIELRSAATYQDRFRALVDTFVEELAEFLARRPELELASPRATAFAIVTAVEGVSASVSARPGAVELEAIANETVTMVTGLLDARKSGRS